MLLVLVGARSTSLVSDDRDLAVAIYGSASFKSGISVGSHSHAPKAGGAAVTLAGEQAELSLHDRAADSFQQHTRWSFYASKGDLRTHRFGNDGGLWLNLEKSRVLKDLNVEGVVESPTLELKGKGNVQPDSNGNDEIVLIGQPEEKHLKLGYDEGYAWIQSAKAHLALNPGRNQVCIGTEVARKKFTVDGGHMRVGGKLYTGGAYFSSNKFELAKGGGWAEPDSAFISTTTSSVTVKTAGAGFIQGSVGIGAVPAFPTFKLQVNGAAVTVGDQTGQRQLTISQLKEGGSLRSWNVDTKKHENLLIRGAPVLIQPHSGVVLFGTTVRKKDMQMHVKGNLYIHGHMYALKNLHVRDHAVLKHLLVPSLSLKGQPQGADGDTLVLGHMTKTKGADKAGAVGGSNLRLGFHEDYAWIQSHGKDEGLHRPLALNPLGNVVSVGSTSPDLKSSFYAKGNGYVLGTLFVRNKPQQMSSDVEAVTALKQSKLRHMKVGQEDEHALNEFHDTTLSFLSVPETLHSSERHKTPSVHGLSEMFASVLRRQEEQMQRQHKVLLAQAAKLKRLRQHLGL